MGNDCLGGRLMPRARAVDAAKYRNNPKLIAKFIAEALATGDAVAIAKAIGAMARVHGMSNMARKTGVRRDTLYRSFSGLSSPRLKAVMSVLLALDVELVARPRAAD
jgi:probable addiction module antidote protein